MIRQDIHAARLERYGWQASPIALRLMNMETGNLIAVLCATACVDDRPIDRWSMQEHHVARAIVFW